MTDTQSSIPWKTEWVLKLLVRFLEKIAPQSPKKLKDILSLKKRGLHTDHSMTAFTAEVVRLIINSATPATTSDIAVSAVNVPLFVNDMRKRYALFSLNHLMSAIAAPRSTTVLWKNISTMPIKLIWSTWKYVASPDQALISRKMNSNISIPWSAPSKKRTVPAPYHGQ